ncbi:hypothetical protein Amsp01_041640 [Amycolatopsis sp. NBRC 101858]|nr:hypothetical protein Amsp01_041640 [Amycolatopsis sp. NBRC 101858]
MTTHVTDRSSAQPVGPPPPFDPELAPVVEMLTSLRPPDAYRSDNIGEMRKPVPGVETPTDEVLSRGGAYSVEERTVPGSDGEPDVSLLICLPKHAAGRTPAIYHIHGGGMIVGDNRFGLAEMVDLAEPMGMAVVSVEYRLAPETPHPGPVEDCYAGLVWVWDHAHELNIDPERIVIGGASAGGGLAAGVTLMARDRNDSLSARQMRGLGIRGTAPRTRPGGTRSSAMTFAADRTCLRTLRLPAPRTFLACRPCSSTSGRQKRSGTRTLPTQAACGRRAATSSCTSGPAGSTGLTSWSLMRCSRRALSLLEWHGCAVSWCPESLIRRQ